MIKIATQFAFGLLMLIFSFSVTGQTEKKVVNKFQKEVPVIAFQRPDLTSIIQEDEMREKNGQMYRIGVPVDVNITPQNNGLWSTEANGDKVWRLKVKYPGAQALNFMFSKFHLFGNSRIDVYGENGKRLHLTYTADDVLDHGQQNLSLCIGDYMMIELVEPNGSPSSVLEMNQIIYSYRGITKSVEKDFGTSENCEVNVNCSEGNNWQDEKRGVARILVVVPQGQGWCTGSLVNNVRQNCTPYFLTAMHCAEDATTSNLNNWRFYFKYEAPSCSDPASQGTLANNYITGCVKIAASEDVNGNTISKSDFYLVHLGSMANATNTVNTLKTANFNAYWNGWDANNTASTSGVGIHHPDGDIKKISTYTSTVTSTTYSGITQNTHWEVQWAATANGHGVTEGGSSGSPLFNYNGGNSRIVGTLSGGSSYCSATNQPDLYGKVSYHWTSVGATNALRLKPWLDPDNTGAMVLDGSSDPCASSPGAPVANFLANQTNVTPGTTVSFTDQTTGTPTSWSWSIAPASGWTYTGSTSASQNPQVIFNTVGTYTVSLTATNANGSDTETKTNYIVVAASSGPCTAASQTCDEYIAQVVLGSINNSTGCTNYTDYSALSTTLSAGSSYTVSVSPATIDDGIDYAYTGDKIGVWIDYNNNGSFSDANEHLGTQDFGASYTGDFAFTVPAGVTPGTVRMRVRINYFQSAGTLDPCGTSQYGEVEDYRIVLSSQVGVEDLDLASIALYPNPTSDKVMIDLNSNFQQTEIVILDLTGKEVLSAVSNNVDFVQLDVSALSSGMYQVVIRTEYGTVVKRLSKK